MTTLHHGDCLEVLRGMPDNSVDSIVTDPPYGLSFMGKQWDYDVPAVEVWAECLRVLKPGGHLLAFAGTKTQHRMAVRIEDAGFEIRDMIAWVYGSGMPKHRSLLKPALEPITVARKPLIGTVAENVLAHGTGGLNIDGCRVGGDAGRWPANFCHDGSDEVLAGFPVVESGGSLHQRSLGRGACFGEFTPGRNVARAADTGSAARFFYTAKVSKRERNDGLTDGMTNTHPTLKPVSLMAYLCRLVTPPGGVVLDPFMGSGSTGKAAVLEGFRFIGIEREAEYLAIAQARIKHASQDGRLL